jgi:hypothetical protein
MEQGVGAEIVSPGQKQNKRKQLPICHKSKKIAIGATLDNQKSPMSYGAQPDPPIYQAAKWHPPFVHTPDFPWGQRRHSTRLDSQGTIQGTARNALAGGVLFQDKLSDG